MPGLPGLGNTLEGLVSAFTSAQKWSSFGAAPQSGMPGGNVISGRPQVATNARALTRILAGAGGSPVTAQNAASSVQAGAGGGPIKVEIGQPSVINLAKEIGRQGGLQGGTPAKGPMGNLWQTIKGMLPGGSGTGAPTPAGGMPGWMKGGPVDFLQQRASAENAAQLASGGMKFRMGDPAAIRRMRQVQYGETFSGVGGKGFSSVLGLAKPAPAVSSYAAKKAAQTLAGKAPGAAVSDVTAGTGQALGLGLAKAAGTAVGFATATVGAVTTVLSATEALKAFGQSVVDGNRDLAKWNGQLAVAQARADIGAIQREQHMARATGGTATMAVTEMGKLSAEFQPIAEDLASLTNLTAAAAIEVGRLLTGVLKGLHSITGPIIRLVEFIVGKGATTDLPIASLLNYMKVQNGRYSAKQAFEARPTGARAIKPAEEPGWASRAGTFIGRAAIGAALAGVDPGGVTTDSTEQVIAAASKEGT